MPISHTHRLAALLLTCAALLTGCHLIFRYEDTPPDGAVVLDGPKGKESGTGPGDGSKDRGKPKDRGTDRDKDPDGNQPSCPAPGVITEVPNTAAGWRLVLNKQTSTFSPVTVNPSISGVWVSAIDHQDEASGFLLSTPTSATSTTTLLNNAVERLASYALAMGGSARLITSGVMKTSHDGHPLLAGLRMELKISNKKYPPDLRKEVAAALLAKDKSNFTNWFNVSYKNDAKTSFVVALALLLRTKDKRAIISGSLASTDRVTDRTKGAGIALDEMSNGTNFASATATLKKTCRTWTLNNKRPMADIVWVMDESGSMNSNNGKVAGEVSEMFKVASRYRLDARMGVTGMIAATKPTTSPGSYLGKLCSATSTDPKSAGGTDRFLLPSEESLISACILDPPYDELGAEFGLANAYKVVTRHLPRPATVQQDKIRAGAELALIVVTDEAPQEMKMNNSWNGAYGFLDYSGELKGCALGSSSSNKLTPFLKQWKTLFSGKHSVHGDEGAASMYLLSRHCKISCNNAETPWGYNELSRDTGGQQGSLCQGDLGAALEGYLEDIIGAASALKFTYTPASASLRVKYGSNWLNRSREKGFDYRGASNTVVLVDQSYFNKNQVTAAYHYWQ